MEWDGFGIYRDVSSILGGVRLSGGEIRSMLENYAMELTQEDWNRELDT